MGNCPPLPWSSPCPDVSFQDMCANNNCHGCCILHCGCSSKPSVPAEAPARDSPPVQLQQPPHRPQQSGSSAKGATARENGGVTQDVPPNGYRFRPSPWRTESGLVATGGTEHDNGSGVAPPGVPGNGDRLVPSLSWLAGLGLAETGATVHDGGGVPRNGDRWSPSSRRTDSGSAEKAWAMGRDDGLGMARNGGQPVQPALRIESGLAETWATSRDVGAAAFDMPLVVPLGTPGNEDRPVPSLSRRPGYSGLAGTGATGHDGGGVARHEDRRAPPSSGRTESGLAETGAKGSDDGRGVARNPGRQVQSAWRAESGVAETWATGRDTGAAAPANMPVPVESGQDSSMRRDSSAPAPAPLPLRTSSLSAGRLSPAEPRRSIPEASGADGMT